MFLSVITLSQNLHTQNVNFLPSNVNPSELRPSDIPSINVLRQIGLSEDEIKAVVDFKYSKGVYSDKGIDSISGFSSKITHFIRI